MLAQDTKNQKQILEDNFEANETKEEGIGYQEIQDEQTKADEVDKEDSPLESDRCRDSVHNLDNEENASLPGTETQEILPKKDGSTPLHHVKSKKALLDKGAEGNMQDKNEKTSSQHVMSIDLNMLLEIKSHELKYTPDMTSKIQHPISCDQMIFVNHLRANGDDVNLCVRSGETSPHDMNESGADQMLDNEGANIITKYIEENTPLHCAKSNCHRAGFIKQSPQCKYSGQGRKHGLAPREVKSRKKC